MYNLVSNYKKQNLRKIDVWILNNHEHIIIATHYTYTYYS